MNTDGWRELLGEVSRAVLAKDNPQNSDVNRPNFSPEVHAAGHIGFEGASEKQIAAAEARLGVRFPPSYRTFLSVSNGWPEMWQSVDPGQLWSTDRIAWARDQDPELVEIWGAEDEDELSPEEHLRGQGQGGWHRASYVKGLLSISEHGDSDLLLSPEVVSESGDWECWQLAAWIPGAHRYASMDEWFRSALASHLEVE